MKRQPHLSFAPALALLLSGCWSAEVEIANLDGTSSASQSDGTAGTDDPWSTNIGTNPSTEPDTNPCDWNVELYGTIETIHGFDETNIYAGGRALDGALLLAFYDGDKWNDLAGSLGMEWAGLVINAIHGSGPTNVVVVGGVSDLLAGILHWTGASWLPENVGPTGAPPLLSVWVNATDDAYASARSVLVHSDGESWTYVDVLGFMNRHVARLWSHDPYDVWGVGQHAFDSSGLVVHYDGLTWKEVSIAEPAPLPALTGIWGSAANDVYVVGAYGTILRYDGQGWAVHAPPSDHDNTHLSAVWGRGKDEVYAVGVDERGEGVVLIRRDGAWTVFDDGLPGAPSALWASASGPLRVASDQGLLVCELP